MNRSESVRFREKRSVTSHHAVLNLLKLKLISYWGPGSSSLLPLQSPVFQTNRTLLVTVAFLHYNGYALHSNGLP